MWQAGPLTLIDQRTERGQRVLIKSLTVCACDDGVTVEISVSSLKSSFGTSWRFRAGPGLLWQFH